MELEEYRQRFSDEAAAPGWQAIDDRLAKVYPGVEPIHWGTIVKYALGGPDPIDGISVYLAQSPDGAEHWHYVTYGFSSLYRDEEAVAGEFSGYGFELTMRLKLAGESEPPQWPAGVMQQLAKYVFSSGKVFDDGHWAGGGGPLGGVEGTQIFGLAFHTDPVLGVIDSPHGEVKFLQMIGLTDAEMQTLPGKGGKERCAALLEKLRSHDPHLVTDMQRTS